MGNLKHIENSIKKSNYIIIPHQQGSVLLYLFSFLFIPFLIHFKANAKHNFISSILTLVDIYKTKKLT